MGTHAIAISSAWEPAWASSAAGGKGAAAAVAKAARRRGLKRSSAQVPAARASLRGGLIVVVVAAARIADQLQLAQRRGHLQPRPSHHHAHELAALHVALCLVLLAGHCGTSSRKARRRGPPHYPAQKTVGRLRSTVQGGTMISGEVAAGTARAARGLGMWNPAARLPSQFPRYFRKCNWINIIGHCGLACGV